MNGKTFIIAEAGVNHNGSLKLAKELVDAARNAGVDCVKFQTFISERIASSNSQKADYQLINTEEAESQLDMLKKLELSFDEFMDLKQYCDEKKIKFLSTPFDFESIDFLQQIGLDVWKIPSGEITNLPYLERIGKMNQTVILSTGMCTLEEVRDAIDILVDSGMDKGKIHLLHCTTEYPALYQDVNLRAMETLRKEFCVEVGYSDHTQGITVPVAAVALGAAIIEKHFTLDKEMKGPDHKASLSPQELCDMVTAIRQAEAALGNWEKMPVESEKKNISVARKSIVANKVIHKGDILTVDNVTVKRPGSGISPMKWYDILGTKAIRDFEEDEQIEV